MNRAVSAIITFLACCDPAFAQDQDVAVLDRVSTRLDACLVHAENAAGDVERLRDELVAARAILKAEFCI